MKVTYSQTHQVTTQTHRVTTRMGSNVHSLRDDLKGVPELAEITLIDFHIDTGELDIVFEGRAEN